MRTPLLAHIAPGRATRTWSHQVSTDPYDDHDVWIETDLRVLDVLFCDGFKAGGPSAWTGTTESGASDLGIARKSRMRSPG